VMSPLSKGTPGMASSLPARWGKISDRPGPIVGVDKLAAERPRRRSLAEA